MLILSAFYSTALAAELDLGLGFSAVAASPFTQTDAPRLLADVRLADWVSVGARLAVPIVVGDGLTARSQYLADRGIYADSATIRWMAEARGTLTPAQADIGTLHTMAQAFVGVGAVGTRDRQELDFLDDYSTTSQQIHPAGVFGVGAALEGKRLGARIEAELTLYQEVIAVTTIERQDPVWLSVEAYWRLGPASR